MGPLWAQIRVCQNCRHVLLALRKSLVPEPIESQHVHTFPVVWPDWIGRGATKVQWWPICRVTLVPLSIRISLVRIRFRVAVWGGDTYRDQHDAKWSSDLLPPASHGMDLVVLRTILYFLPLALERFRFKYLHIHRRRSSLYIHLGRPY